MLNLDELLGAPKSVKWGGVEYPVAPLTLRLALLIDKNIHKYDGDDMLQLYANMGDALKELVPGLDIETLPIEGLTHIFGYATGQTEEPATPLAMPGLPTAPEVTN